MTAPRRVLRYEVPIDGDPHEVAAGKVLMACRKRGSEWPARELEVWVEVEVLSAGHEKLRDPAALNTLTAAATRQVVVLGTGQLVPGEAEHLASCIDDRLVWHLYEISDADLEAWS